MIISWLTGGLGNQMFQYAAGLALAEQRRTVLKLDPFWFKEDPEFEAHNRYALSCWNVNEQFATKEEIDRIRGVALTRPEKLTLFLARKLRLRQWVSCHDFPGNLYSQNGHDFATNLTEQPDNTYLRGMFQSETYFKSAESRLRSQFTLRYPKQANTLHWEKRIKSGPSIALHFRWGDYIRNPDFNKGIGLLGFAYYEKAIEVFRAQNPNATIYIFSDDIEGVAKEFTPSGNHEFVRGILPEHAHEKIYLMSLCNQIAVANSTFAWWAAWLNSSESKQVIAPDPWFNGDPIKSKYLIPSSWTKLPR